MEHKNKNVIENWINEYINNKKNPLYSIIMNVLAESSPNDIWEVYRTMGMKKLTEENRKFLLDAMDQLGIKEKYTEEGRKKEKYEIAKNLLDILDEYTIAQKTGLTVEEVRKLNH